MSTALNFSYEKKLLSQNNYDKIINHLKVNGLPFNLKKYFSKRDTQKIVEFMTKDKKNYSSKINLILLKKIGTPIINNKYNKTEIKFFFNKLFAN